MKTAAFMRNVPVLAGLSDELLGQLAAEVNKVPVEAGDWRRTGQFGRVPRGVPERLSRPVRRALTGSESPIPRLGETIVRTLTVSSIDTVVTARETLAADPDLTERLGL